MTHTIDYTQTEAPAGGDVRPTDGIEVMHPSWCRQVDPPTAECTRESETNPLHLGPATAWPVQSDDVEITIRLVRLDEMDAPPDGGQYRGEMKTRLSLMNTAMNTLDGQPIFADVDLGLVDLDLLITFLSRHRAQMVRPFGFDLPAERPVAR